MRRSIHLVLVIGVLGAVVLSFGSVRAGAQTTSTVALDTASTADAPSQGSVAGPMLTLDRSSAAPGERVQVTFSNWTGRLANVAVCGNGAKRGSADCDMIASTSVRLFHVDRTPMTSITITAPPATCPCVIRAIGVDTDESAAVPFDVVGQPSGPVVGSFTDDPLVEVSIATSDGGGVVDSVRGQLGGPVAQQAEVHVRNVSADSLRTVKVHGLVERGGAEITSFDLEPGMIGPGQTWTGEVAVSLPSPSFGAYDWTVTASGGGPVVSGTVTSNHRPVLLVVFVALLVGDIVFMATRWRRRRIQRRPRSTDGGPIGSGDRAAGLEEPVLVG